MSISDLYFIAHFVRLLRSVVGVARRLDVHGLTLDRGDRIEADVVIKAVGFAVNCGNERILGRSRLHGGSLVDRGLWTLYEPQPDGNFSSSAFGSYLDSVPFAVRVMLRYWCNPNLYGGQLLRLLAAPHSMSARINHITGSQSGAGLGLLVEGDPQLLAFMREHVVEVAGFSSDAWSPSQFLEQNRNSWASLHEQLQELNGAGVNEHMPYPMDVAMDVIRREKPDLFSQRTAPAVLDTCSAAHSARAASQWSGGHADMEAAVMRIVRDLTGASTADLTAETPLMEAGVDSLAVTELSSRLRSLVGVALSPTMVFEQPTPRAVAAYLREQAAGNEVAQLQACAPMTTACAPATEVATVLTIAHALGQWPGGCDTQTVRMRLQCACGDATGLVPAARWTLAQAVDVKVLSSAQTACVQHGGFVTGVQRFDARTFGIAPAEASAMDPQQRLLLEHGYAALHASTYRRILLIGGGAGVFLGIERPDWPLAQPPSARGSVYAVTGDNVSVAAGRVSFALGLQGPCSSVDTACASSLTALHWGSHAVRGGETGDALALAVSLKLVPHVTLGAASAGMLSVDGRCKTLDARANGYARSEGVGALVVVNGHGAALALQGSAVRQDGRSASLTAPNGSAQRMLLLATLECSSLRAVQAGCIEAHGTGTALGDPTEVGALVAVLGSKGCATSVVVGAVKASVGHSEAASGLVGLLRMREVLSSTVGAGNAQLRSLNPLVGEQLRSRIACVALLAQGGPSRLACGVSSFGYSGTIAHTTLTFGSGGNEAFVYGSWAAEAEAGIPARCARTNAGRLALGRICRLVYSRLTFPWRNEDSSISPTSHHAPTYVTPISPAASACHLDADTPLMEAGIRSHQVVQITARLQELAGTALSATFIFEHPTPRAIASHLSTASEAGVWVLSDADVTTVVNEFAFAGATTRKAHLRADIDTTFGVSVDASLPASTCQQHFLLLHLLQPHVASYSLPVTVEWSIHHPPPMVRAALQLIVRRHAVLRTSYSMDLAGAIQVILPADGFAVPLNVCGEEDYRLQSAKMLSKPFALTRDPPIRALLTSGEAWQCTRLLVVVDHVAADYASTLILQRELCEAPHRGGKPALPHLQLQYADFALWRQRHSVGDDLNIEWWRQKLDGAPQLLKLPLDRPRQLMSQAVGDSVNVRIDSALGKGISTLCVQEHVSTLCCLLSTWAGLMMKLSMQDAIVLGQPYSLQLEYAELRDLIGCFTTPIMICLTMPTRAASFRQLLRDVYSELLQAIDHANVPLFRIVEVMRHEPVIYERSDTHNTLFQSIVQLLPRAEFDVARAGDSDSSLRGHLQGIDLFLNFVEDTEDGSFQGNLLFNAAILDRTTAAATLVLLTSLLRDAVSVPDAAVHDMLVKVDLAKSRTRACPSIVARDVELMHHANERISPFEIEEMLRRSHEAILDVVAFTAPHRERGKVVAVAVMLQPERTLSRRELCASVAASLPALWLPQVLVYVYELPMGPTGVPLRHELAERLGLQLSGEHEGTWRATMVGGRILASSAAASPPRLSEASLPMSDLLAAVLDAVRKYTRDKHVAPDTPLMDAGLNSMSATQLALQLEERTGVALPPTLIFQYSTAEAIARHLHSELAPVLQEQQPIMRLQDDTLRRPLADAHVASMAARWPNGAVSDHDLARLANAAHDAVSEVPASRWLVTNDEASHLAARFVAHVQSAELFDSASFAISPAEALWMDPQQRLLLEKGYKALHDDKHSRFSLVAHNTACTVGIQANDFANICMSMDVPSSALSLKGVLESTLSVAAGRLSYVLGMQGACHNIDTACSSALVAAHSAATMVRDGECANALSLAVNLMLLPLVQLFIAIAGITSTDGACKFLDVRANGYVRSEGVGAMLLAPERGVESLRGSAVRSDGKSASLTAPNGEAQVGLLRAAMLLGALSPAEVQTIECHGTGTALGDPIETRALCNVMMAGDKEIVLGGVKANVGHAEPASGMIGLSKVSGSFGCTIVAPNAQLRVLSPHVSNARCGGLCRLPVQGSGLFKDRELPSQWASGVSSFGYAGTIAHAMVSSNSKMLTLGGQNASTSLAFGARGADAASKPISEPISEPVLVARRSNLGMMLSISYQAATSRLYYRRRFFPWQTSSGESASIRRPRKLSIPISHDPDSSKRVISPHLTIDADADTPLMQSGVTSVMAVRLSSRLRALSGADLSPTLIFECPTPRAIAAHLTAVSAPDDLTQIDKLVSMIQESVTGSRLTTSSATLPKSSHNTTVGISLEARVPCSSLQYQLLLYQQLQALSTAYNQPVTIAPRCDLDMKATQAALQALVRRHAVLRTSYHLVLHASSGTFFQIVQPADAFAVPLTSCLTRDELDRGLRIPFDLFAAPPVRAILLRSKPALLIVNVHHVAADMEGMAIIRAELTAHCEALLNRMTPTALPPIDFEYIDFAVWENGRVDDQTALTWWALHLEGVPETITLPIDRPRPDVQNTAAKHIDMHLDVESTELVLTLTASAGATLNCALLTMWGALLMHFAKQECVVIGLPHSMRYSEELRPIVGMFINTLPLRMKLPDASIVDAVSKNQCVLGQALRHAHIPFFKIVAAQRAKPATAHSALYQAMFQVNTISQAMVEQGQSHVHDPTVKVDVELQLFHYGDKIGGFLIYDSAIYNTATVQRWVEKYERLLELAAKPAVGQPHLHDELSFSGCFDALTVADEACILHRFNDTAIGFADGLCLHQLVEEQADRTPSASAVEWEGVTLAYYSLMQCTENVAHELRVLSVAADDVVVLQLHRSHEQVVGVLSVLAAGGAYLPLDPKWPANRRQFMLEDAGCATVIAQSRHLSEFEWFSGHQMALDDVCSSHQETGCLIRRTAAPRVTPSNLAYVMYTSGSTGMPKGVMVPHAGVVNLLFGTRSRYPSEQGWVAGLSTVYVFDVFVHVLFTTLGILGGTCLLLEDGKSLLTLDQADTEQHITFLASTSSILSNARVPSSVRHVDSAGEALTQAVVDNMLPSLCLYNYFGPTEASVYITGKEVVRAELPHRLASIGRPLPNVTCFIVAPEYDHRSPWLQPIGVFGELWVGGVQVTRGYLRRPERTAEIFVSHPWVHVDPSGRGVAYLSGDRARWYPDGEIEFGGRVDFQVKIRGQRVELGEIEHVLCAQPGILEAVVLLRTEGEPMLVAYVRPASVVGTASDGTQNALPFNSVPAVGGARGTLPPHMLPSLVVGIENWPQTSSGKIDRKQLPPPEAHTAAAEVMAPRTAEEVAVRDAFAVALRLDAEVISVEASFFELGGNSLRAIVVARSVTEALGRAVYPAEILQRPTVVELAGGDAVPLRPQSKHPAHDSNRSAVEYHLPTLTASVVGLDSCVAAHLARIGPEGTGIPVVTIPAVTGHSDFFQPLAKCTKCAMYGIVHRHLQTGAMTDLVATLPNLVDDWAAAILSLCVQEHDSLASDSANAFFLLGASIGGLLAHRTAIAARVRGHPPCMMFLIDPTPPIRSQPMPCSSWLAASMVLATELLKNPGVDLSHVPEHELGIVVAAHLRDLGGFSLNATSVMERQREVRVATHLLQITASHFAQSVPTLQTERPCDVFLVVSSERETDFTQSGILPQEASVQIARCYGNIVDELVLEGDHASVCTACGTAISGEFCWAFARYQNLQHLNERVWVINERLQADVLISR